MNKKTKIILSSLMAIATLVSVGSLLLANATSNPLDENQNQVYIQEDNGDLRAMMQQVLNMNISDRIRWLLHLEDNEELVAFFGTDNTGHFSCTIRKGSHIINRGGTGDNFVLTVARQIDTELHELANLQYGEELVSYNGQDNQGIHHFTTRNTNEEIIPN